MELVILEVHLYKRWVKWYPSDAYGCGKIIKQAFNKTVGLAGNTEESIRAYRDSVKIFTPDMVLKTILILRNTVSLYSRLQ